MASRWFSKHKQLTELRKRVYIQKSEPLWDVFKQKEEQLMADLADRGVLRGGALLSGWLDLRLELLDGLMHAMTTSYLETMPQGQRLSMADVDEASEKIDNACRGFTESSRSEICGKCRDFVGPNFTLPQEYAQKFAAKGQEAKNRLRIEYEKQVLGIAGDALVDRLYKRAKRHPFLAYLFVLVAVLSTTKVAVDLVLWGWTTVSAIW